MKVPRTAMMTCESANQDCILSKFYLILKSANYKSLVLNIRINFLM